MADSWDDRDALIDGYEAAVGRDVNFVFGRFLAGLSDDPRDITFDIVLLDLLSAGMNRLVSEAPLRERARAITRTLPEDAPAGFTRGLDDASDGIREMMHGALRELAQDIANLANQMKLFRRTGFRQAVSEVLDRWVKRLADQFGQALLVWERAVLDRIADMMQDRPLWMYAGPADRLNRPFCGAVVRAPRVYTREGVERLNAHPLLASYVPPNVFMMCGGYNCRHVFLPVSRGFATTNGLEVDE